MSLVKIAYSKKDVEAYNNEFKQKAGISPFVAPVAGGLAAGGLAKAITKKLFHSKMITPTVAASLWGSGVATLANHVRVHHKMDEKIRRKIVDE